MIGQRVIANAAMALGTVCMAFWPPNTVAPPNMAAAPMEQTALISAVLGRFHGKILTNQLYPDIMSVVSTTDLRAWHTLPLATTGSRATIAIPKLIDYRLAQNLAQFTQRPITHYIARVLSVEPNLLGSTPAWTHTAMGHQFWAHYASKNTSKLGRFVLFLMYFCDVS